VIVPARGLPPALGAQLDALAGQDFEGEWELLVAADSASIERVAKTVREHLDQRRGKVIDAGPAPNASQARNRGAAAAQGDFLAFCDADDVVRSDWVTALAAGARRGDLVAGRLEVESLNAGPVRQWHDTPPWELARRRRSGFLPCASTANLGVWAEAFHALGGFDEHQATGEDKDFSWRAQLASYRLHFASEAVTAYRHRPGLIATARQHYAWGQGWARLYRSFAERGMSRCGPRDALRAWTWSLYTLPTLVWSSAQRGRWVARTALRAGHLAGSLRYRVVFL
jgi:glycosyltransferase involved in cell wall biosynthesis